MRAHLPRAGPAVQREAVFVLGLAAAWISAWALLTAAAWFAGGHPSGSPTELVDVRHIAAQYQRDGALVLWHLVGAYSRINVAMFWFALTLTICVIAGVWVAAVRGARGTALMGGVDHNVHNTSGWARWRDLRALRVRGTRVGTFTLGRCGRTRLATEPETSVLVIGPTRSGKTSSLMVPNLLDWRGPAVVTSTKSELVDLTAAHRQTIGPVHVYDPTGELAARYRTVTWSPITGCDSLDRAWMVASWLCAGLQQGSSRGDNDWAHWAESGKLLVAPLLFAAAVTDRTIVDVQNWIHGFDLVSPMSLLEDMAFAGGAEDTSDAVRAMAMLTSVDQRPERERGTVLSTVMRIFNVFNERMVAESALTSRFDAERFLRCSGTLYLCTPRQTPERVSSLFVGLLMSVVTCAYLMAETSRGGRLASELGLFLDELANIVPVEELPALASQGAGRGVMLMSIVQDLSQLRARYGADRAHSILNNHGCKVILPGIGDPETADIASRLVGRGEFTDVQVSRGPDGRISRSFSVRRDAIASADALRRLPAGSAVVVHRGHPPAQVRLRPWFGDRRYRALSQRRFVSNAEYVGES